MQIANHLIGPKPLAAALANLLPQRLSVLVVGSDVAGETRRRDAPEIRRVAEIGYVGKYGAFENFTAVVGVGGIVRGEFWSCVCMKEGRIQKHAAQAGWKRPDDL